MGKLRQMIKYIAVSLLSGLLFGVMDGVINANPLAVKLYAVYQPIMRTIVKGGWNKWQKLLKR